MSKYIDAEKLISEIERLKEETPIGICEYDKGEENGRMEVLTSMQSTIDSLQQEQPMPDSTKLIELWHEDKEMLKEKDFRDDPWRLAYNAFMCGFGRGIAANKQEQPQVADASKMEQSEVELNEETIINEFRVIREKCFNEGIEGWQREKLIARYFYELGLNARKEE